MASPDTFDPTKKIVPPSKPRVEPWPQQGQDIMSINGTRVTFHTIRYDPDHAEIVRSIHIMHEHDNVYTIEFQGGMLTTEAVKVAMEAINIYDAQKAAAERRAAKPVPGTIGGAVHRLIEEANNAYDTLGDEFDLEDLKDAVGWVEGFLVDSVIVRAPRPR